MPNEKSGPVNPWIRLWVLDLKQLAKTKQLAMSTVVAGWACPSHDSSDECHWWCGFTNYYSNRTTTTTDSHAFVIIRLVIIIINESNNNMWFYYIIIIPTVESLYFLVILIRLIESLNDRTWERRTFEMGPLCYTSWQTDYPMMSGAAASSQSVSLQKQILYNVRLKCPSCAVLVWCPAVSGSLRASLWMMLLKHSGIAQALVRLLFRRLVLQSTLVRILAVVAFFIYELTYL